MILTFSKSGRHTLDVAAYKNYLAIQLPHGATLQLQKSPGEFADPISPTKSTPECDTYLLPQTVSSRTYRLPAQAPYFFTVSQSLARTQIHIDGNITVIPVPTLSRIKLMISRFYL
jgi:hypothetical protein